jgi:hypothetical protein
MGLTGVTGSGQSAWHGPSSARVYRILAECQELLPLSFELRLTYTIWLVRCDQARRIDGHYLTMRFREIPDDP